MSTRSNLFRQYRKRRPGSNLTEAHRKRMKTEDPIDDQLDNYSSEDPEHERRMRALHGLPASDSPPPNSSPQRTINDILRNHNGIKVQHGAQDISDILGSFRAPSRLPLGTDPRLETNRADRGEQRSISDHTSSIQRKRTTAIDLTEDDDDTSPSPLSDLTNTNQCSLTEPANSIELPQTLTHSVKAPSDLQKRQMMDARKVPDKLLVQARNVYASVDLRLPLEIATWAQLKAFVIQNPNDKLTVSLVLRAQARFFDAVQKTRSSLAIMQHQAIQSGQNEQPGDLPLSDTPSTQAQNSSHEHHVYTVKQESIDVSPSFSNSSDGAGSSPFVAPSQPDYLNHVPDLLPVEAGSPCPRLIDLHSENLLNTSLSHHVHLSLPDVVCSVLYIYETANQSVLRAFLESDRIAHFFFLFKSRSNKYQSWSVEREHETITVSREVLNRVSFMLTR